MQTTNYKGINYGLHDSNLNTETGIRYGVISMHAVGQAWFDEADSDYGMPICLECFNEVDYTSEFQTGNDPVTDDKGNEIEDEYYCSVCDKGVDENDPDIWRDEPLSWYTNKDDIEAHQTGDDTDIFVTKSRYFTYAQFCSPCAPGAVHLENPLAEPAENNKGYCFGHDWFESGKAPYPVYSVETGKLV